VEQKSEFKMRDPLRLVSLPNLVSKEVSSRSQAAIVQADEQCPISVGQRTYRIGSILKLYRRRAASTNLAGI